MRILVLVVLGVFLFNIQGQTQIVNIEDKRYQKDTTGWFGLVDLSLSYVRNSGSVLSITGTGRVDYLRDRSSNLFLANYRIVRTSTDDLINDGFVHYRYGRKLNRRWQWEVFGQMQYNERLALTLRTLIGTGPRLAVLDKEKQKIYFGLLYMYEYDELSEGQRYFHDHRLSMSLALNLQLTSILSFASTSYYQPLLTDIADSRLSSVNSVNLQITGHLSFRFNFNVTYDARISKETESVPSTIYNIMNGLRWTF